MNVSSSPYANWKAPVEDRQLLIWPQPQQLLSDAVENGRALRSAEHVRLQNCPLPELRQRQRASIGHAQNDQPLIASGHQAELYHPGVWVKDVLADTAARQMAGRAMHIAVDADQPKHLNLRWPGETLPITDDPAISSADWTALLKVPTAQHLRNLQDSVGTAQAQWNFQSLTPEFLKLLAEKSATSANLAVALTEAQHRFDQTLGLQHETRLTSAGIANGEVYHAFVYAILADIRRFAADYNGALAQYRGEAGITSLTRPMPDLLISDDWIEAPFWLDDLAGGQRERAKIHWCGDVFYLDRGSDSLPLNPRLDAHVAAGELQSWLGQHQLRLAPRALTLTMFLRLFVADQFIHGIGGGRYDQVTDLLIERHFKLAAPRFAVTTATLLFPESVGRQRVCISCLVHQGHRLRHSLLGSRKSEILREMESLPRRSLSRSLVFHNMHSALSMAASSSQALRDWEEDFRKAEEQDRQDEIIFDRELFYGIQPRERLVEMIELYRERFN